MTSYTLKSIPDELWRRFKGRVLEFYPKKTTYEQVIVEILEEWVDKFESQEKGEGK